MWRTIERNQESNLREISSNIVPDGHSTLAHHEEPLDKAYIVFHILSKFVKSCIINCMEYNLEKTPTFKIEEPKMGDEIALAPMHIKSWKETYVIPESGLTEAMVDDLLGHLLTNTEFRKNTISSSLEKPDEVFYRVVKNSNGEIVGFMHGSKNEETNELEGIYLLDEVKGHGTGGALMEEFLAWINKNKPTHLEVFSFNERALSFYTKYGFEKMNKPVQRWKGLLPFIEMMRPADESEQN